MNRENYYKIFERLSHSILYPKTELEYVTPFELLISVLLSAHATDISVNKATRKLYIVANTPDKIYQLGVDKLMFYIKTINLYRTKAQNIMKTCGILLKKYNGEIPQTREALQALPGVGRKTANVVLNIVFGYPTIGVDTHVYRVSNRTGLAHGKNVYQVEKELIKNVPMQFQKLAHHWLILHGRYVCTARQPKCLKCVISDLCEFYCCNIS